MFTEAMPNLYSADVARATVFYRDLLGFRQTFQYPAEGPAEHVELRLGDTTIAISSNEAVAAVGLPAPSRGHPLELVVWCEDTDAAVDELRTAGTPVVVEPTDHVAGHRRGYVSDPDGNWVAIVNKRS